MPQSICLDGTSFMLDADRLEVHVQVPGLKEISQSLATPWIRAEQGQAMEPVAAFEDGTTVYFHCPPEGETGCCHYVVESARAHHWRLSIDEKSSDGQRQHVAHVQLVLD